MSPFWQFVISAAVAGLGYLARHWDVAKMHQNPEAEQLMKLIEARKAAKIAKQKKAEAEAKIDKIIDADPE